MVQVGRVMVHSYLNHKGAIAVAFSIPERGRDTSRFTCAPLSSYQSSGQQHSWNVPEEDVVPLSAHSPPPPQLLFTTQQHYYYYRLLLSWHTEVRT